MVLNKDYDIHDMYKIMSNSYQGQQPVGIHEIRSSKKRQMKKFIIKNKRICTTSKFIKQSN